MNALLTRNGLFAMVLWSAAGEPLTATMTFVGFEIVSDFAPKRRRSSDGLVRALSSPPTTAAPALGAAAALRASPPPTPAAAPRTPPRSRLPTCVAR